MCVCVCVCDVCVCRHVVCVRTRACSTKGTTKETCTPLSIDLSGVISISERDETAPWSPINSTLSRCTLFTQRVALSAKTDGPEVTVLRLLTIRIIFLFRNPSSDSPLKGRFVLRMVANTL